MSNHQTNKLVLAIVSCVVLAQMGAISGCGAQGGGGAGSDNTLAQRGDLDAGRAGRSPIPAGSYNGTATRSTNTTVNDESEKWTEEIGHTVYVGDDGLPQMEEGVPLYVGLSYTTNIGGFVATVTSTNITVTAGGVLLSFDVSGEYDDGDIFVQMRGPATIEYTLNPDGTLFYSSMGDYSIVMNGDGAGGTSVREVGLLSLDTHKGESEGDKGYYGRMDRSTDWPDAIAHGVVGSVMDLPAN